MFGLGAQELLIVMAIGFLLFGGRKLPEIGEGLGKGINSFKRALQGGPDPNDSQSQLLPGEPPENR